MKSKKTPDFQPLPTSETKDNGIVSPGTRMNLCRVFSKCGLASRTQAIEYIHGGRIKVNGEVIRKPSYWVDLQHDEILFDDRILKPVNKKIYILLHKPKGYLSTREDHSNRKTVYDLVPQFKNWIFPVGRLDMDSEGLLLLTNDGPFGDALKNPENRIVKTYHVLVNKRYDPSDGRKLEQGINLGDFTTLPAMVNVLNRSPRDQWIAIGIVEGKNRQVRRMLRACGYKVLRLIRTTIGPFQLGDLPAGQWRYVTPEEGQKIENIKRNR
ncbi:rRNA pseudouridine synthase [candidate division KSB1 bacterium]|nr:rRNA pseudouridine synthase [candidate division KSB1 bacterium]